MRTNAADQSPGVKLLADSDCHYVKGTYYFAASDGKLIRVNRGGARLHLQIDFGLSRRDAERHLDEIKDFYVSHPDEAFQVKRRYIRESTNVPLTEDEVTEVALHGWRKIRARDLRRWRNDAMAN